MIAGLGILVGVAYTLRALQQAFFGEPEKRLGLGLRFRIKRGGEWQGLPALEPITIPERIGAVLLLGASLLIGLYPNLFLQWIIPSLVGPLFDGFRRVLP